MSPLLFLVADKNMEYALRGFFERDRWDRVVPCAPFTFDVDRDIRVAAGQSDPGLYTRANELLRPFRGKYRRVAVMIDAEWDGSPGAEAIRQKIQEHIASAAWDPAGRFGERGEEAATIAAGGSRVRDRRGTSSPGKREPDPRSTPWA